MSSCSIINSFYHLIYPSSRKVEEQWSFKMMSLLNMTESGCADQSKNGYFQSQEKQASTSELLRRTCRRKQSPSIWEPLMKKKAPRGNPKARVGIQKLQHAKAIKSR